MQTFEAHIERAVAIELKEKVNALYFTILPIFYGVSAWTLNALDPSLPVPFDVKLQLDNYTALTLDKLKLTDWVTLLKTAQSGDELTYPTPPSTGGPALFDANLIFSDELIF